MKPSLVLLLFCHLCLYVTVTSKRVCGRPPVTADTEPGGHQRVFEPGEELALSCKQGYIPIGGSRKIICTASGEWTKPNLKCSPKSCPAPDPMKNGETEFLDIVFKSTINYTCHEGYVLHGASTSQCLHDGKWSHPAPFCEPVTCGLPTIPRYGKITYDKKLTGNITEFGFGGTYECLPPLSLFGNERALCTANGNWTEPPECRIVSCPIPSKIDNGFMTFATLREHGYKDRVKYGCDMNYVLDGPMEIECQKTGNWSTKPACRAPCTIGIKRGRIFYNAKKMWIEDLKPNQILHSELVAVYCLNKEKNCGYPIAIQCIDGTLKIPECFEEPGKMTYQLNSKTLPSEITMC